MGKLTFLRPFDALAAMVGAILLSSVGVAHAEVTEAAARLEKGELPHVGIDAALSAEEIRELTADAFYWGLNIAGFYELRYVYSQFEGQPAFRGINRMQANNKLMDASVRYATTVNASTLYAGGMFDVSREPIVVETPAVAGNRYWSVQAADQNAHHFLMVGSQFTSNIAHRYLVVGPHWHGSLPPGFRSTEIVRASSNSFTLAVRVAVTTRDEADMMAARHVVHGVAAAPLGLWQANGGILPSLDRQPVAKGSYRTFPRMRQIVDFGRTMTAVDLIQLLSLSVNDPSLTRRTDSVKETATLARLARLGIREGALFDPALLTPDQVAAAQAGFAAARRNAKTAMEASFIDMNGWRLQGGLWHDDLDYVTKAGVNDVAWGTPVPYQSHTIAYLFRDVHGRPLDGNRRYTITFNLSDMPPVTEFWELPVYDSAGYFMANPINRNSVTSYQLAAGAFAKSDGKVTFYLQAERPSDPDKARNWLPVVRGDTFQLAARYYGPLAPLVDGSYRMPAMVPAD